MFANVSIINVPIALELEYSVPNSLEPSLMVGHSVIVPLGAGKAFGVVIGLSAERQYAGQSFALDQLLPDLPAISTQRLGMAAMIADVTCQPLGVILRKMLPPLLGGEIEKEFALLSGNAEDGIEAIPEALRGLIDQVDAEGHILGKNVSASELRRLDRLARDGAIAKNYRFVAKQPSKKVSRLYEAVPGADYFAATVGFGKLKNVAERRQAAYECVKREGKVVDQWIFASSGCVSEDLKWLISHGYLKKAESEENGASLAAPVTGTEFRSTQSLVGDGQITLYRHSRGPAVIEVYANCVKAALEQGKFVWLIYPEILEADTAAEYFRGSTDIEPTRYHSGISEKNRTEVWHAVSNNTIHFVIGTLDALFLPAVKPGTIILDEAQDIRSHPSAIFVMNGQIIADAINKQFGSGNIYASLLHSVTNSFNAKYNVPNAFGVRPLLYIDEQLTRRSGMIVDMAVELKHGNLGVISTPLRESIQSSLSANLLSVLFLNRRGYANYIFCRDCGSVLRCERCGSIIHVRDMKNKDAEVCGNCGFVNKTPKSCPNCGSQNYRPFGAGIRMVEEAVHAFAPNARVALWESGGSGLLGGEITYARLLNGEIDVLIGTQSISKNIRFPKIGTLGFVLAESSFNHPDPFRIENMARTHLELLSKTESSTDIILQSYQPREKLWQQLLDEDKDGLIESQLASRSQIGFPPFGSLTRLKYTNPDIDKCAEMINTTRRKVIQLVNKEKIENYTDQVIAPDPTVLQKNYNGHLILRNFPNRLIGLLSLPVGWSVDVSPNSLYDH